MKIGELATRAGLAPSAIRFYEQSGLLPAAPRGANGYRVYADSDLQRLRLIQLAQSLGFSLDTLRTAFATDAAFDKDDLLARVAARLAEIDELLHALRAQRQDLHKLAQILEQTWTAGECLDPDLLAREMSAPPAVSTATGRKPRKRVASVAG